MESRILQALSNYIREADLPIESINGRRASEILALLSQDRSRHSVVFEYVCALEFGLVPWTWLDPELLNRISAYRYKYTQEARDMGVDCASLDASHVLQAKWRAVNNAITFRELSTYITYSLLLSQHAGVATRQTVAYTEGARFEECIVDTMRRLNIAKQPLVQDRLNYWIGQALEHSWPIAELAEAPITASVVESELGSSSSSSSSGSSGSSSSSLSLMCDSEPPDELPFAFVPFERDANQRKLAPLTLSLTKGKRPKRAQYANGAATVPLPHQAEALEIIRGRLTRILNAELPEDDSKSDSDVSDDDDTDDDISDDAETVDDDTDDDAYTLAPMPQDARVISIRMACGTGKSGVIGWTIKWMLETMRVLTEPLSCIVLVPSIQLQSELSDAICSLVPGVSMTGLGGGQRFDKTAIVCVCVYNSMERLLKLNVRPQVVVIDEAHHLEGAFRPDPQTGHWRGRVREFNARAYLLMSATLEREDEHCDYSYSLGRAIADRRLVDITIAIPVLRGFSFDVKRPPPPDLRAQLIELVKDHPEWSHILAYCNTCDSAREFAEELRASGVQADYFDGTTTIDVRRFYIDAFECGRVRVLCTVAVLGEGVDIPCANTCMFIEPRNSKTNVVQCVGRVMRLCEGKNIAYVVCPSTDEDRELRRMIQLLGNEYPALRESIQSGKIHGRVEICPTRGFSDEAVKLLYTAYTMNVGRYLLDTWEQRFEELRTYVEKNDKYPLRKDPSGLGSWISTQRTAYKKHIKASPGAPLPERLARLGALPGWTWAVFEMKNLEPWDDKFKSLDEYVKANGKYPPKADPSGLGQWISDQRQAYKKHIKATPDAPLPERLARLGALPGWTWAVIEMKNLEPWDDKFKSLDEYVKANGKYPPYADPSGLGKWIDTQRTAYKKHIKASPDAPLPERFARLGALPGWSWAIKEMKNLEPWDDKFKSLDEYVKANGKYPPAADPSGLGSWINSQRQAYKKHIKATPDAPLPERLARLGALPGWTWAVYEMKNLEP